MYWYEYFANFIYFVIIIEPSSPSIKNFIIISFETFTSNLPSPSRTDTDHHAPSPELSFAPIPSSTVTYLHQPRLSATSVSYCHLPSPTVTYRHLPSLTTTYRRHLLTTNIYRYLASPTATYRYRLRPPSHSVTYRQHQQHPHQYYHLPLPPLSSSLPIVYTFPLTIFIAANSCMSIATVAACSSSSLFLAASASY